MDLQTAVALLIVGLAAAYLVHRWFRAWSARSTKSACGCGTCPVSATAHEKRPKSPHDHSQ